MKDKLEDFIDGNRMDFEHLEPRIDLWVGVENKLDREQANNKNTKRYWLVSAAASIVLIIGMVWVFKYNFNTQQQVAIEEEENPRQELVEVEEYYAGLIDQKKADIRLIVNNSDAIGPQILEDLDDLDSLYIELKQDLDISGNNDRVINAMIQNLQLRVEILNKQLMILEQINKYEEDESIAI